MRVNIENTINEYNMLRPGERVVVGLSGGADSVALTHVLVSLGYDVRAVHINHMIRGEQADEDESFVRTLCRQLGIELTVEHIDVPLRASQLGIGLEMCGRICRYECFDRAAQGDKIATAHTLSDNAETVLMNLTRGCSLSGLRGIPPIRGNIIRPLINSTRADIERYCEENRLSFVTDSTNSDIVYTRNRVRLRVIPELCAVNPSFAQAVGRMSRSAAVDEQYLSACAQQALDDCAGSVRAMAQLPESILRRVLMLECSRAGVDEPDYPHLLALADAVRTGSGCVQLSGGIDARIGTDKLTFAKAHTERCAGWSVPFSIGETILPDGRTMSTRIVRRSEIQSQENINNVLTKQALDYDTILSMNFLPDSAVVRTRREGDRFKPIGRPTKKLKKLLSEAKIPLGERDALTIIESDGDILWLEHFGAAERYKTTPQTQTFLLIAISETKQ